MSQFAVPADGGPAPPASPSKLVAATVDCAEVGANVTDKHRSSSQRSSSRTSTSSLRLKLLKDAVPLRSGEVPCPDQVVSSPSSPDTADLPCPHHLQTDRVDAARNGRVPSCTPPPRPLFPPTTLIVGDSITRNICFFNTITHCYPVSQVMDILEKLQGLLRSLPPSITRLIVHVGSNDTARRQSKQTKKDFNILFNLLQSCGLSVWISSPLPVLSHSAECFSRLLALNTWLQFACSETNFCFIDNFNLFWNHPSFFLVRRSSP